MPIASALAASCDRPFVEMPAGDVFEIGAGSGILRIHAIEVGRRPPRWTGQRREITGAVLGCKAL